MGEFVAQMSLEELAKLNCGSGWGVANENTPIVGSNSATVPGAAGETLTYDQYGIPSIVLADGPGGIRVKTEIRGKKCRNRRNSNLLSVLYRMAGRFCSGTELGYGSAETYW